jgi:uncharacterized membrane protein HdeD (DUF308 family)
MANFLRYIRDNDVVAGVFVAAASSGRMRIASKAYRAGQVGRNADFARPFGGEATMLEIQALDIAVPAEVVRNWGWFLAFGIGLMLLGILAIVRSVVATVVSMLFFGWLLVIAAGIEIVQLIMVGKWAGQGLHVLGAILFGVVGLLIVWRPIVTAEILTLLMGAFFLVAGLFQLIEPFWIGLQGWGWHVLNGLITLVLGVLVLAQWPVSGLWVIGLFVGIELIFYGGAWVALALSLRGMK